MNASPYDGRHLIAELHGCSGLDDVVRVDRALRDGAAAAGRGAPLLRAFTPRGAPERVVPVAGRTASQLRIAPAV